MQILKTTSPHFCIATNITERVNPTQIDFFLCHILETALKNSLFDIFDNFDIFDDPPYFTPASPWLYECWKKIGCNVNVN